MSLKSDKKEKNEKYVNFYKGNCPSSVQFSDDSGYSSDSSLASASSLKVNKHENSVLPSTLDDFLTPDINWKKKLRYKSTPLPSNSEAENIETPPVTPIEGPLFKSKTYPLTSISSPSLNELKSFLNILSSSEDLSSSSSLTSDEKLKESPIAKKCLILRSPLKSPFKLIKKQKSAENISTTSSDIIFSKEVKERTVKALFISRAESPQLTHIRRLSPRFSSILSRLIDSAFYILPNVFSFLSGKDLVHISHTCHLFRQIVHGSSHLSGRKKLFVEKKRKELEQQGKENVKNKSLSASRSEHTLTISSPRKHLQELQNSCPPQKVSSPKLNSRFDKFVKEGEKLYPGETQQKCIHCQNPAHISGEFKAVCTSKLCGLSYCTRCLLPFHEKPSDCLALKPKPKVSTASKIWSKACKKRLRRL